MLARLLVAVLVVAGTTAFAPAPFPRPVKTPAKGDTLALEGTWALVSVSRGAPGGTETVGKAPLMKARIQNGKWSFLRDVQGKEVATTEYDIILDTQKKPAWIDLKRAGQGTSLIRGVVQVQGDTLRMLYAPAKGDGERPTTFEQINERHLLMTFRRAR